MRVLVTGAQGFVGKNLVKFLQERRGIDVVPLTRTGTFRDLSSIDAIVHTAASGPWHPPVRIVSDNVTYTHWLLSESIWSWEPKLFIFLSSISVYGEISEPVVDESTPLKNPDAYGMSKRLGELMLESYSWPSVSLRLPGIVGPGAHEKNWLPRLARNLLRGEPVRAFNLYSLFNNVVHTEDLARFILHLLKHPPQGHETVTLGASGFSTVKDVILKLATELGVNAYLESQQSSPAKPSFTISSARAQALGYRPSSVEEILARYAQELKP